MKKHMISFFTLLLLIIAAVTVFVMLVKNYDKGKLDAAEDVTPQATLTPTVTVAPTAVPTPTVVPEVIAKLYPISENINDETKFGYIDKSGKYIIDPSFDMASDFYEGVAIVTMKNKYCVIDEAGNILFINDSTINDYCNGAAVFSDWDGADSTLYGYVDTKGKIIIEPQYTIATNFNEAGTAYVATSDKEYKLIDKTGKVLESYTLDDKYSNSWTLQDGYIIYGNSDYSEYGVVNVKGEEILPSGFSEITYLGKDLFAVKEPGLDAYDTITVAKLAIFNSAGDQLTDYSFYAPTTFANGYCSLSDDTSTFFIGVDGKEATNLPKFEGKGTVKLFGDVVSAYIDGDQMYCTTDKTLLWQTNTTYALSDTITVKKLKYKPIRDVLVHYPQVEMTDPVVQELINKQLYSIFVESRSGITEKDLLTVDDSFSAKLIKNLLIIEKNGYDYSYVAAHGMPIMDFYYIDTTTGGSYQLKDLFLEGSDYAAKITALIADEINADIETGESMYIPGSFVGISENQYFKLEENSLIIYFYPYDIAAYAAGFPEFTIPFEDISDYINKDGFFWKSFNEGY